MRKLSTLASAFSLVTALSACGSEVPQDNPDTGSGPIPAPKDAGPDLIDMAKLDMNQMIDAAMDLGHDADADIQQEDASSDIGVDSGTEFMGNNLKIDCEFDPLDSKTAYTECMEAADKVIAEIDPAKQNYISEYGIAAISADTRMIQPQQKKETFNGGQPQLDQPTTILNPSLTEVATSNIVEEKIICQLPEAEQITLNKLTADPNIPFNNCDPSEQSCDLSFTLNDIELAHTANLVSRFRFQCPDLGFDPKVDGEGSNVDTGQSTTVIIEVPFAQSHIINPDNCELDPSIYVVAVECRAFDTSLRKEQYEYFSETFETSLRISLTGTN